ncbi:MAG TPA: DUF4262 domain-containing protein [Cellulomonas sp.]
MCEMCDGTTPEQFVAEIVGEVESAGWSIVAVEDDEGRHVDTYTVGLTRVHGHPELIVSGGGFHTAHHVLDELAAMVSAGRRFEAGELLGRAELGRECLMVQVVEPSRLVMAQAVYAMPGAPSVPALQVVWADKAGRWPWELCREHTGGQEVYGPPPARR